jgi:NitT/TauT family transport system substrate-binding protein
MMLRLCAFLVCLELFSAAVSPSTQAGEKLDKIDFRLDWSLTGYHLPFYWAAKKGYYREEGLDVDIKPGAGSQQTINLVAGEHDEIGFADYSLMAASAAKGMKVKAIFGVVQSDAWAIYSHVDAAIRKPADLTGKSVVLVVDHKPMIDLLLKLNGVDPTAIQLRLVNPATRGTVFAQTRGRWAFGHLDQFRNLHGWWRDDVNVAQCLRRQPAWSRAYRERSLPGKATRCGPEIPQSDEPRVP